MSIEVALIVILAAALNAGWNSLIKVSGDKIASMATVTLMGAVVSAMVLPFVKLPDPASWPLLALAIILHTAYHFALPIAYKHGFGVDLPHLSRFGSTIGYFRSCGVCWGKPW